MFSTRKGKAAGTQLPQFRKKVFLHKVAKEKKLDVGT